MITASLFLSKQSIHRFLIPPVSASSVILVPLEPLGPPLVGGAIGCLMAFCNLFIVSSDSLSSLSSSVAFIPISWLISTNSFAMFYLIYFFGGVFVCLSLNSLSSVISNDFRRFFCLSSWTAFLSGYMDSCVFNFFLLPPLRERSVCVPSVFVWVRVWSLLDSTLFEICTD